MADFAQDPNSVQGVLQSLLGRYDPEARQKAVERRDVAQETYGQSLNQPMPDTGPINRMVSDYLTRYAANPNQFAAIAGAAGSEAGRTQAMTLAQQKRLEHAASEEARMAEAALKAEDDRAGKFLALGKGGLKGSSPVVKMDKDGNMVVHDPMSGSTKVVHSSQAGQYQRIWTEAYKNASSEGMENPEQYAHGVASNVLGISPNAIKPIQPGAEKPSGSVAPVIGAELPSAKPQVPAQETFTAPTTGMSPAQEQAAIRKMQANLRIKDDPNASPAAVARAIEILQSMGGQVPSTTPQAPTIAYRDKPAAALAEGEAKGVAAARGKEYEAVQMAGSAAETQLQAFNTLEKIKPNTNAAANAQEHVAGLFNALGADPNSPMIQNAIKNRESNQILDQLRNASLKAENGVQTKSDEDRIGREFPKTTDFSKAWDFGLKLGKERALRAQERLAYYDSNVAGTSNVGGARSSWNREYAGDPITQYLGGKLIFRNDFINSYVRKYPDAGREGAIAEWRELEKDYQARGGKK